MQFKFDLNDDEYFPGQSVYIDVYASKDSYVAFSGIDESVLLVGKERHDFNKGDVLKELALYGATNDAEFDLFHVSFMSNGLIIPVNVCLLIKTEIWIVPEIYCYR